MRFSQRLGLAASTVPIQTDSISDELRNGLWNAVYLTFIDRIPLDFYWQSSDLGLIAKLGHNNFFKLPLDELPDNGEVYVRWLKQWFMLQPWFAVYDFVDWLANYGSHWKDWQPGDSSYEKAAKFRATVNHHLETENSGYRFVDSNLIAISNEHEVAEIEKALSTRGQFSSISSHVGASARLLSNRVNPDYRNSIKESISAVEAAAKIATDDPKATLGQALKLLAREEHLHPALQDAFSKLYGWTNDAEGIRHAMMEQSKLDLADARFMLVACSAFANYLVDRIKASQ
ncbi:AbiJ-NTD4 domain-containing protein [Neorhizobium sp. DT-125]|uniref:AbiJ-NTD4 domain-containing protein n=1 Tax=Neorhizobium sp. DT-125 TaxID=3396163 RepID=UPI003F1A381F